MSAPRWALRTVPADLVERYRANGWWNDRTVGQMVFDGLSGNGDVEFNVYSKVRPYRGTLGDIDARARALAAGLQQDGVQAGDVVVIQMPNWAEAGIAYWAACYLGAVVVPIVHFYGAKEVGYILRVTEPDVVITPERFGHSEHLALYSELLADRPDARWLVVSETPAAELPARARTFESVVAAGASSPLTEPAAVDPDNPAIIGFTSGTTRDPKGVIHSHNTIGFETRQLEALIPQGGPPQLTGAPVGHFIGMLNAFLIPLLRDRPVNLLDVWDPGVVLGLLEQGLGLTGGATFFLTSLLDHPNFVPEKHVPMMPFAGLGGSAVPLAVTERAEALGIQCFRSYGSTEHPSITGCTLEDPIGPRLRTDGRPMESVEMRLDEDGEIYSRGADCFMGYTDPDLTASVFDGDGWYRTGDVGVLDSEGYLSITDRVSDVIIRGGENISAQEIEELMLTMPAIAEVAVVAAPDARLGEHAAALVRLRDGHALPTVEDVREHLAAAGLARQKWPEDVLQIEDFPRTASGKVQKFKLRQQLRDQLS
jgi:acyl-CoA synthetase (AMP-forming)/AMP-acid ligase II